MPDPRDSTQCLQWWPVDVVGSSPLSVDSAAGYIAQGGRFPLYYCLEAEGNAPYVIQFDGRTNSSLCLQQLGGNTGLDGGIRSCHRDLRDSRYQSTAGFLISVSGIGSSIVTISTDVMTKYMQEVLATVREESILYADVLYEGTPGGFNTVRLTKDRGWLGVVTNGVGNCQGDLSWSSLTDALGETARYSLNVSGRECDLGFVHFTFREDGYLGKIDYGFFDGTPGSGNIRPWYITLYKREGCQVITQVVTPDGVNRANVSRLKAPRGSRNENSFSVPGLNYTYGSDGVPFGAVVHPDPDDDPTMWNSKLFIEPPLGDFTAIGQARAGQPYSAFVRNFKVLGTCKNNPSVECSMNDHCKGLPNVATNTCDFIQSNLVDCGQGQLQCTEDLYRCSLTGDVCTAQGGGGNGELCPPVPEECAMPKMSKQVIGPSVCISGSDVGRECRTHEECGEGDDRSQGVCAGPEKPSSTDWQSFALALARNPKSALSTLFVETYGTWQWVGSSYKRICGPQGVPVCVGGVRNGAECGPSKPCPGGLCGYQKLDASGNLIGTGACADGLGKEYGWGIAPPAGGIDAEARSVPPVVRNIRVNGLPKQVKQCPSEAACYSGSGFLRVRESGGSLDEYPFDGIQRYSATLTFNSNVSEQQLPLKRYTVDWGDGYITSESDLMIRPKDDPANPHSLGHAYVYHEPTEPYPAGCTTACAGTYQNYGCTDVKCEYQIRVQIEDNWGWCNENVGVPACGFHAPAAWAKFRRSDGFPQVITVWKSESDFIAHRNAIGIVSF